MKTRIFFILALAVILTIGTSSSEGQNQSQGSENTDSKKESPPEGPDLADIIPLSAQLSGRLATLENTVRGKLDISSLKKKYAEIEANLELHAGGLKQIKESDVYRATKLLTLRQKIGQEDEELTIISRPLKREIRQLETWRKEWLAEKKRWDQWQSSLLKEEVPDQLKSIFTKTNDTINTALNLILPQLQIMLTEQEKVGTIQEEIYSLTAELDRLITEKRYDVLFNTSPPMFSSQYTSQFRRATFYVFLEGIKEVLWPGSQYLPRLVWTILIQSFAFLFLSIAFYRNRQMLNESKRWHFLAARPFSAGLFLICMTTMFIYEYEWTPPIWKLINMIICGLSFVRLVVILYEKSWVRQFVYGLAFLLITTRIMEIINFPRPLFRLYITLIGFVSLYLCWRWARECVSHKGSPFYTGLLRLGFFFFVVIIIAELWGKEALPLYIFLSLMRSIAFVIIFLLFMRIIQGGLEWVFRTSPLQRASMLYSGDIDAIIHRTARFVAIALWGLIVLPVILMTWGVYDSMKEAVTGFLALGFNIGSQRITVGLVIIAAGVFYGSFLISWIFQKLFMDVVFRKRRIEKGAQLSIERLIHYVVIFIGFLLAISALGFEITKITIVLSALGVGIGFGLQSIVNNFVSGLILLFERPVRVGDTVEIGGQWAKIMRIGLRATTVQTFAQSDLIIPNADLTTNQVTNWTLTNRQVRLIIPVGVVYGSDVPLVLKTLLECANTISTVAKTPEPQVLFLRFGESSLDFELRVWVDEADNRLIVKSELHQEIDRRFREANIVIAFPQRDLHLRSMDESITLRPPTS